MSDAQRQERLDRLEREQAEESSASVVDNPGASPTEDGLIEKALGVMGVKLSRIPSWRKLRRVDAVISASLSSPLQAALFIHECKLYLREKGYHSFHFYDPGKWNNSRAHIEVYKPYAHGGKELYADTEVEAYAEAVLYAQAREVELAEQAASQSVPTENASSGGQG